LLISPAAENGDYDLTETVFMKVFANLHQYSAKRPWNIGFPGLRVNTWHQGVARGKSPPDWPPLGFERGGI